MNTIGTKQSLQLVQKWQKLVISTFLKKFLGYDLDVKKLIKSI